MKKIVTSQYEEAVQQVKVLPPAVKNNANKILNEFGKQYWPEIPIKKIIENFQTLGIDLVNEDGSPFSAIFAGEDGRTNIDLQWMGNPVKNSVLTMTWHKMPSGNYEIVAYLG